MDKSKNYINLKRWCLKSGIDLFGVASIDKIEDDFMLSSHILEKVNKAISLGIRLSQGILEDISNAPTRLYFHHYRTVNTFLDQVTLTASHYIQKRGYFAVPLPASQIIDWQKQRAHLSHKKIGILAGLGWLGRNNLLVNERLGSQFRLSSILTDMPLSVDKPRQGNCENCQSCIEVCPAKAIKDNPFEFDHLKCFEKLKEFQRQHIVDQYICGICVKVCRGGNKNAYKT